MTVQVKEFELLVEICKHLRAEGARPELATALQRAINRMHKSRSGRGPETTARSLRRNG